MPNDYASQIDTARKAGYSDDDIVNFIAQSDPKMKQAVDAGYSSGDILTHLGGQSAQTSVQPAAPAPVPWYKQALNTAITTADKVGGKVNDYMNQHPSQMLAVGYGMPVPERSPMQELGDALPEMPATKIARASDLFNQVRSTVGDLPVQTTNEMKDALDGIKQASALGSGGGSIADKVVTRLVNSEESPLSYDEARTLYSNLGQLTSSDKMASNKNMLRLLGNFKSALGDAIENTVGQTQALPKYQEAMDTFAKGSQQQEKLDIITDWAKKAGVGAAVTALGGGLAGAGWDLYKKLFGDH